METDLRYNNFGGMLTETIGNLSTNLQNMDLDPNQILGSIPSVIGNLINLEHLWLLENQFTEYLEAFKLFQILNLSNNDFEGAIPTKVLGWCRGILEYGATIVAVKVLNLQRHGDSKSFIAECKALRNIKHRNLVKVLTACSGVDYQEMFTGKRPTDDMFKDSLNLHNFVRLALPHQVVNVADPMLFQGGEEETSTWNLRNRSCARCEKIRDCLISILQIEVTCFAELLKERMNISALVA
ncbi:hypothetical protein ACSBR2_007755 [Camellia fascicularis]